MGSEYFQFTLAFSEQELLQLRRESFKKKQEQNLVEIPEIPLPPKWLCLSVHVQTFLCPWKKKRWFLREPSPNFRGLWSCSFLVTLQKRRKDWLVVRGRKRVADSPKRGARKKHQKRNGTGVPDCFFLFWRSQKGKNFDMVLWIDRMGLQKKKSQVQVRPDFFFCVFFHQKFNGTESQRTPKSLARANTYSGLGVRSVSPVGDFLDFLTFTVSAIDFFLFGFLLDLDLLRFSGCFLLVEITSHLEIWLNSSGPNRQPVQGYRIEDYWTLYPGVGLGNSSAHGGWATSNKSFRYLK